MPDPDIHEFGFPEVQYREQIEKAYVTKNHYSLFSLPEFIIRNIAQLQGEDFVIDAETGFTVDPEEIHGIGGLF